MTHQNLESQITPFRSTCPLLISLISTVKLYFPFQRACLKRRWALAPVDVLEGVNMTVLQENSSLWLPGAQNRTGLSCIPAHLPTCFSSSGALYLHSVCPPDRIRPEPQRRSHQRASNTRGQTNCKRPSYINGAKVLCFIWTCLALFVCAPHSFVLGEILSTVFSSNFKYASRWCQDIWLLISTFKSHILLFCFFSRQHLHFTSERPHSKVIKRSLTVVKPGCECITVTDLMNHVYSVDVWCVRFEG